MEFIKTRGDSPPPVPPSYEQPTISVSIKYKQLLILIFLFIVKAWKKVQHWTYFRFDLLLSTHLWTTLITSPFPDPHYINPSPHLSIFAPKFMEMHFQNPQFLSYYCNFANAFPNCEMHFYFPGYDRTPFIKYLIW